MTTKHELPAALKIDGISEEIANLEKVDEEKRRELQKVIDDGTAVRNDLNMFRQQLAKAKKHAGELRFKDAQGENVPPKELKAAREAVDHCKREIEELEEVVQAFDEKARSAELAAREAAENLSQARLRKVAGQRHALFISLIEDFERVAETVSKMKALDAEANQIAGPKNSVAWSSMDWMQRLSEVLCSLGLSGGVDKPLRLETNSGAPGVEEIIRRSMNRSIDPKNTDLAAALALQRNPLPSRPKIDVVPDDAEEGAEAA